jgi:hypothetical protein
MDFQCSFKPSTLQTYRHLTIGSTEYGNREDLLLTVLVNKEDGDDWNNYKHLLKEWVDFKAIPWDSPYVNIIMLNLNISMSHGN